jgi:hypothetical protein
MASVRDWAPATVTIWKLLLFWKLEHQLGLLAATNLKTLRALTARRPADKVKVDGC